MEKDIKNLKLISWLFIVIAILNAVGVIIDTVTGEGIDNKMAGDVPESVIQGIIIALVVIMVLGCLIKLFIGMKGLAEANGKTVSGAYLVIAIIILVFDILGFIGGLGDTDIWTSCSNLADIIVMFVFVISAKRIRKNKADGE